MKTALTSLLDEYATDIVAKKLVPFANSQRNEAFNSIVGAKNPKIWFYGGSGSSDFWVECAVAQKNIGYGYINKTLTHLGIEPGSYCSYIIQNQPRQKREEDKKRKSEKKCKVKRHFLYNERLSKNARIECKEGKMYETAAIGLNLLSTPSAEISPQGDPAKQKIC